MLVVGGGVVVVERGTVGGGGSALDGQTEAVRSTLERAKEQYESQVAEDSMEDPDSNPDLSTSNDKRKRPRHRSFYLDVPEHASAAFLKSFEALTRAAIRPNTNATLATLAESVDWTMVLVLIRSGSVSLGSYPLLLEHAARAHRLDVLAMAVRYVSDITERDCMRILTEFLLVPDAVVCHRLGIVGGVVTWGKGLFEATPSGGDTSRGGDNGRSTSASTSASFSASTPAPESKKKRKGAATPNPAETDSSSKCRSPKASELFTALPGEDKDEFLLLILPAPFQPNRVTECRMTLIRALFESAVLDREAAFSTLLLAEAAKKELRANSVPFFIRVLVLTMQGVCRRTADASFSKAGAGAGPRLSDRHIRRAVTWIEALIDSHFTMLALTAASHAPTTQALVRALQTVAESDTASEEMEGLLGLWMHLDRAMHNGSALSKPPPSQYQVEVLCL